MHRKILGLKKGDGKIVDHINGNSLDNRKANLRICTQSQNMINRIKQKNNKSGYIGVCLYKGNSINKWRASIMQNKKQISIGYFDNKIDAAKARDTKALELYGEYATLNFPMSTYLYSI